MRLIDSIDSEKNQAGRHISRLAECSSFSGRIRGNPCRNRNRRATWSISRARASSPDSRWWCCNSTASPQMAGAIVCRLTVPKRRQLARQEHGGKSWRRSDSGWHYRRHRRRRQGAAIGTAAGAGVGGGAQAASKSQQIKLPSETVLNFTLQAPVTIIKPTDSDAARPKLGNS